MRETSIKSGPLYQTVCRPRFIPHANKHEVAANIHPPLWAGSVSIEEVEDEWEREVRPIHRTLPNRLISMPINVSEMGWDRAQKNIYTSFFYLKTNDATLRRYPCKFLVWWDGFYNKNERIWNELVKYYYLFSGKSSDNFYTRIKLNSCSLFFLFFSFLPSKLRCIKYNLKTRKNLILHNNGGDRIDARPHSS